MQSNGPELPDIDSIRAHVILALNRYWSNSSKPVEQLPIAQQTLTKSITGPLRLIEVKLPKWAYDCGVEGSLFIPKEAASKRIYDSDAWQDTNWWLASFLLLEAWHERVWEHAYGPIHSFSFRLIGWDDRAWKHAWVNRIALFLRQWVKHVAGEGVLVQMGPLPISKVQMTHDVDAVEKTFPIRLKQGAFNLFNAARSLSCGQFSQSGGQLRQAARFMLTRDNWWSFDQLLQWEADANIRATYHFYADKRPKTFLRWLFDPSYDINSPKQISLLRQLSTQGHAIGLHPGFENWKDPKQIATQRYLVEAAAGTPVTYCRQHWLRFSWQDSWSAQQSTGLTHDSTLMFNDRPGFRNSSALSWRPFDTNTKSVYLMNAMPSVFMDSHFYDYKPMSEAQRNAEMRYWIEECHTVRGEVAVLWHPHTLSKDYGWAYGFRNAIEMISAVNSRK